MQANGYLLPANGATNHPPAQSGSGRGSGEKAKPSNRVKLNGNIVRRKPGKRIREYWDIDLPGFGLRVNPGGRRTWFVLFRQRGKLRRVSLGTSRDISPATARRLARAKLAEVALDGLPTRKKARSAQKSDAPPARLRRTLLGRLFATLKTIDPQAQRERHLQGNPWRIRRPAD